MVVDFFLAYAAENELEENMMMWGFTSMPLPETTSWFSTERIFYIQLKYQFLFAEWSVPVRWVLRSRRLRLLVYRENRPVSIHSRDTPVKVWVR